MSVRVSSPRFVGRSEELAALEAALARAYDATGAVVLVGAEAGMGKSRLIAEFVTAARVGGASVLIGECPPLGDGELPYAPIVGAVRSLARERGHAAIGALAGPAHDELARLLPELDAGGSGTPPSTPAGSQARLFEQLLSVFVAVTREAPLVLVIEDLHWSDPSTRDFLAFLVASTRHERLMLVVSYRDDELQRRHPARPFLVELERSGEAVRLQLTRFTRSEIREQVAAIRGTAPAPELIDGLLERAEGNPFFTEELLVVGGTPGAGLPESLRDALLLRVEGRAPDVEGVLRLAAVSGLDIDHALLEAVAGLPEDDLASALRDAVEGHVLISDPGTTSYAFRHALLREAVYADLLPGERQALHLMLARALAARPELAGDPATATAELAHHWYAARELPEALVALLDAGTEAENVHALREALRHYDRAIEIWDEATAGAGDPSRSRIEVMRRAADIANLTGDTERAIELAHATLACLDPGDEVIVALLHERLGRYLWTAGHGEDALPEYRRAVELMPESPPTLERALVLAAEAQVLMLCHRLEESASRCEEALAITRAVDAATVEAHVLNTMCANFSTRGEFERAVEAAAQARSLARELGDAEETVRSHVNGGDALDQMGRVQESIALAWEGIDVAAHFGADRMYGDFLRGEIVGRLLRAGRWAEAEQLLDDVLDHGPTGIGAANAYGPFASLLAERGDFDAATQALQRVDPHVRRSGGSMWLGPTAEAKATVELWSGEPRAAQETIEDCLTTVADGEAIFSTVRLYELGARAAADLAQRAPGDRDARLHEMAHGDALRARLDVRIGQLAVVPPRVAASRQACAAECARIEGRHDGNAWKAAQALWDGCGDRYQSAYAAWRRAEALVAGGGDRRAAERLGRDAHAIATELGARPLRERLEGLARRARLDIDDRGAASVSGNPLLEDLDLTPRELEVLALLAEGMTNREIAAELFISPKTASVHVSRILGKLAVPNRAAAAAAAQRLGVGRSAAT